MKRHRFTTLFLAFCLAASLGAGGAGAVEQDTALETIRALGIMAGDDSGSLNLSAPVTRAQFVTMMTAASPYKGTVGEGSGVSLFKDVKSGYWGGGYIKLAVEQGWMSGYVDGTFRPDSQITLEEACTALLKLLGYDSASLAGSYPEAQLTKAASVGLRDDLTAVRGQVLTRQDCVYLFYNLLVSDTSAGAVYGATLGYTVTNGQVDYSTLVSNDTKGPYVADGGMISLPFSTDGATVYRDGSASSLSAVQNYDVYYYNANLRTVWVYSRRVSGTLTGVSPSAASPSSVTVAGLTYELGTSTAVYKCSSQGSFTTGDVVTLLLGMNGEVVDVVSSAQAESVSYGTVVSSRKVSSTSASSAASATVQVETKVACTDGTLRTFYTTSGPYSAGKLVSAWVDGSGTTIKALQNKSLSGSVNSAGTSFAGYQFADGVEILDTDGEGSYARIYPSRLAGARLSDSHVRYYTLDGNGDIDRLILEDATGDVFDYVYITSAQNNSTDTSTSAAYSYFQDGQLTSLNSSAVFSVSTGGAALIVRDGSVKGMRQLNSVNLTQLGALYAMAGNQRYDLDEEVQVILRGTGSAGYYTADLSEIDTEQYSLKAWYDNLGYPAGGRVRVIVATPK